MKNWVNYLEMHFSQITDEVIFCYDSVATSQKRKNGMSFAVKIHYLCFRRKKAANHVDIFALRHNSPICIRNQRRRRPGGWAQIYASINFLVNIEIYSGGCRWQRQHAFEWRRARAVGRWFEWLKFIFHRPSSRRKAYVMADEKKSLETAVHMWCGAQARQRYANSINTCWRWLVMKWRVKARPGDETSK